MIHFTYVIAVASIIALTGCSSPAGLDRVMDGFARAAQNNEAALSELDKTSAQRLTEITRQRAIEGRNAAGEPVRIRPPASADCSFNAPGCELRLMTRDEASSQAGDAGTVLVVSSLIPNQLAIAREISLYAVGIKQTAAADDTDKLREGFSKAMEGVCGLAGTLGTISGVGAISQPACEAFRAPLVSFAAFVYGEYQTQAKLSALRSATRDMQPLLTQAADYFSTSAEFALDGDVRRTTEAYDAALGRWEAEASEKNLTDMLQAASRLDAALKARRELGSDDSVFQAFAGTHKKIVDALNDQGADLSSAITQVERLVRRTEELVKIAREFKKGTESADEIMAQSR